jgi:AsmA family/TamB, inner membrane protein subunit of TAM complex
VAEETVAEDTGKRPPPGTKSKLRRALRVIGIVLAVPVVIVVLAIVALHTGPGQRKVRDLIVERVGARMNGSIALGELDFALLGDLTLTGVSLKDGAGTEVVALDRLHVAPNWSALAGGQIAIDEVAIDGVRLTLVEDDDGKLNVKSLFKKQKKKPPKEKKPPKKDRHVVVKKLHVGDVNVTVDKKDGTKIALRRLGIDGSVDTIPTKRTAKVSLQLGAQLALDKPADGLAVSVTGIGTGLAIDVIEGSGTIVLAPSTAHAKISQEGFDDRELDFELDGIDVEVKPGELGASLKKLALGALVLRSLELDGAIGDDGLEGEQRVQLVGMRLDADKLNRLLQKKVLASDVSIETKISGPPEAMKIDSRIETNGGHVVIDGVIDASDRTSPSYELSILATDIATEQLLESDKVPPITVDRLRVGLRGKGRTKNDAEVDIGLHIAGVKAKGYVVDDVVGEVRYDGGEIDLHPLRVQAYGHELLVRGWVDLNRKLVDARVTMAGDVGKTLANLREGGIAVRTKLPRGLVVLHEDVVTIDVTGQLEGRLDANVAINDFRVFGGAIHGRAHAELFRNVEAGPDDKKVELKDLDALVELKGISINQVLAFRGKKLEGIAADVSGKLVADDVPESPWLDYDLAVRAQGSTTQGSTNSVIKRDEPMLVTRARGRATKELVNLELMVDGNDGGDLEDLVRAKVRAPLVITDTHKGIAPWRPMHVEVTIDDKRFKDITYYLPAKLLIDKATGKPRKIPRGSIDAAIVLDGSAAAPTGTVAITIEAKAHPLRRQRVKLDGTITSEGRPKVALDTGIAAWVDTNKDQTLKGRVRAELSRSPIFPGPKAVTWSLDLDLLPQVLEDWVEASVLGLEGVAKAGIHLEGTHEDLSGSVKLDVDRFKYKGKGPVGLHLALGVEPDKTKLDLDADFAGTPLLDIAGQIGRPGKGLIAALRDKTPGKSTLDKLGPAPIDVTVTVPKHKPSTYASLKPKLAKLPGTFGGSIHVGGDLKTPVAKGSIGYQDFQTRSGKEGRAALVIDAGAEALHAAVEIGPRSAGSEPPVAIVIDVPRTALRGYLAAKKCWGNAGKDCKDDKLPIAARIDAHDVELADLVPAFAIENADLKFAGKLDWDLNGDLRLDPKPRYRGEGPGRVKLPPVSPDSKLDGRLQLKDATLALLTSGRHYEGVQLDLSHTLKEVRLERLALRESDREKKGRKLDLKAHLALDELRPGSVTAHLSTKDWLVFGHEKVGPMDAPRATIDAELKVEGDLSQPIKRVHVTVPKLALLAPNRFRRAHQPEALSSGDIIELKEGMTPGELPVPEAKKDDAGASPEGGEGEAEADDEEEAEEDAEEEAEEGSEQEAKEPVPVSGLDLVVHIPNDARILLHPLDLVVKGDIEVKRRGDARDISGELAVVGGSLALGGRKHILKKGTIGFSNDCIACVDLLYGREEHNATLRDVSEASVGKEVTIRMQGPLTNRKTTLGGAASPGTLYDLLSAHNAGRMWHVSQPDMPATNTVEFPHYENLLLLSYLSVNVPSLLFMDKVAAWADAYDGRGTESYGKLQRYEAEGYSEDGKFRVRASAQPEQAGASEHELSFDYLFNNTPQTAFGVGVSAGDRLGGGPGIFFEWSSKD